MRRSHRHKGATLIACLIFLVVFLALVASLAATSRTNLQIAANQRRAGRALAGAESGLEVMRYWLSHVMMDATTPPSDYFQTIINQVKLDLQTRNATDMKLGNDGTLQAVSIDSAVGQSFSAQLNMNTSDPSILDVAVTGACEGTQRTVRVGFDIAPYKHPIFNYGMATKGPVQFPNNPTTTSVTDNWEADIYTESSSSAVAVYVGGNTNFDGDISVGNASAAVDFVGDVQIAGDTGQTAIDNHVFIGVDPVDFPEPDTNRFVSYATGPVVDANAMDLTKGLTLTNATIPAGTNPTFDGTVTIEGILLIEQPNVVTFNRNVELRGIMVGTGTSTSGSQINIGGNFASLPYPSDSQFDALRQEQGTSILTPGFDVSFTGNYSSIEGVVAANSLYFSGNASAVLHGSLISYSDSPTVVAGNVSLTFDRANSVEIPAGFDTKRILEYNPTSYAMAY
jgi:Tfp pilus assembly protein PilX